MNVAQGQTCFLIPKPTEQGLQSKDIEKRRQGSTLLDQTLDRESLLAPSVHLNHRLWVVIYHSNQFVELRFESGGFQNSHQEPMVNPIGDFGLINLDQCGFGAIL